MKPTLAAVANVALLASGASAQAAGPPAPAPPAGCTPPTDGRVGFWRGEDSALDSVGANDGTLEAGAGFRTGRVGRALSLPGDADRVTVPAAPALDLTGDVTLETWVQIDDETFGVVGDNGVGGDRVLFWKVGDGVTFAFFIEGDGTTAQAAPLRFLAGNSAAPGAVAASGDLAWTKDTWYHVAVTRQGDTVTFYRDGVPVGSATIGQPAAPNPGAPLVLGAAPEAGMVYNPVKGGLDEAGIWSRALGGEEIRAIHDTATGACATPPPLPPPPVDPVPDAQIAAPLVSGRHVTFDASASTNVVRYAWDFDNDGRPDVDCGSQPRLTTTIAKLGGDRGVVLLASDRTGTSDSATATAPPVTAARVARARAAQLRESQYADVAYCDGGISLEDLTQNGGPPPGCDQRVVFGLVEAQGCLAKVATRAELRPEVIDAFRRAVEDDAELEAHLGGLIAGTAARASQNATPKPIDLESALDLGEFYTSDKPVRINGLDLYPRSGSDIVLSAAMRYVIAQNAVVRLESAIVRSGSIVLNVAESRGAVDVGDVDLTAQRPRIGGFPLSPQAHVTFIRLGARRVSRVAAHVDLAGSGLTLDDGRAPVLDADFIATNDEALVEQALDGRLERVSAGAWPVRNGAVAFRTDVPAGKQCNLDALGTSGLWTVAGDLLLGGLEGYGLKLTPPPFNGICFENGRFKSAGATLGPPILPVPIAPAVLLEKLGMNFSVDPSVLRGKATISGAGILTLEGDILAAFPSSGAPFRFVDGDLPLIPPGFDKVDFVEPVFGVGGTLSLRIPLVDTVKLVDAGFAYGFPAKIGFGARLDKDFLGIVHLGADVRGALNFENGRFNLVGNAYACVIDIVCAGAIGVLSNVGVGACINLGGFQVGGGVQFPAKVFLWPLDGCKWTRFTEDNVFRTTARAAQLQQAYPVTVAEAGQSRAIELRGDAGAPIVRVIGPDGETAELPAGANYVIGRRIRIMRAPGHKITAVGLQDPLAGTYRIERLPNSASLSHVATASALDNATITAEVDNDPLPRLTANAAQAGAGTERTATLRYAIARRPGQTVTFLDGGRILGEIRGGGRGKLRFASPQEGRVHAIVARPALNGITVPGEERVVARFRASRQRALRAPSRLRAMRRGGDLVIRWRGPAQRYAVVVRERGGKTRSRVTSRLHTRVRVSGTQAGTVVVRPLDRYERAGPARRVRFRAAARARTRFLPYRVLHSRS